MKVLKEKKHKIIENKMDHETQELIIYEPKVIILKSLSEF